MATEKQQNSHRPPTDSGMAKEEFIRVGTTLYKIVEQPKLNGGYIRKRIAWNNETLRQDYGKDYIGSVPKYDGFCTVPEHVNYQPVIGKFLNLYEPIDHQPQEGDFPSIRSLVEHIFCMAVISRTNGELTQKQKHRHMKWKMEWIMYRQIPM